MIVVLQAYHVQNVYGGAAGSDNAVHGGLTLNHGIVKQRVGDTDVTVYAVVVCAESVCVVAVVRGCADDAVKEPCGGVVSLYGWRHEQCCGHDGVLGTVQALHVFIGVGGRHVVLVGVRVNHAGAEFHELDVKGVVHADGETVEVRACTHKGSLLGEVVQTHVEGAVLTATGEIHVVILTDAGLEHFLEPVGVVGGGVKVCIGTYDITGGNFL